ncbi:hypothetical protein [Pseudanabaena sp. FACHB-2040]|uniref:hypothetical protein n=1 Tax=Pseudanabaena sp. FACHB-2040 TaxID=2692859 RepID=UPI0016823216|nr:hypothetical protein [Pseudanabaena sp. FACHB-2040]MBD2256293.1 hypothetical protein [Pseudanabaena sp. FACHB-2040]
MKLLPIALGSALLAGIASTPPAAAYDSLCYMVDAQGGVVDLRTICGTQTPSAPQTSQPGTPSNEAAPSNSTLPSTGTGSGESGITIASGFADGYCDARRGGRSHNDAIQEASIAAYNAAPTIAPGNPAAALDQLSPNNGLQSIQEMCPNLYTP